MAESRLIVYHAPRKDAPMRNTLSILLLICSVPVAGCALPDWMVPRLWKPVSSTASSREAQQERFDRKHGPGGGSTYGGSNGVRPNMLGSREYIPGASSSPFAP
jgi:hypothetical protein